MAIQKERVVKARSTQDIEKLLNKPTPVNTDSDVVDKLSFFNKPPIPQQSGEVAIDTLLENYGLRKRGNITNFDSIIHTTERVRQDKAWHIYGGFQSVSETITLANDTWTHITNATNNLWVSSEQDGFSIVADDIIVANTGDYMGNISLTLTGGNSKDFLFRLYNVTQDDAHFYIGVSTTVSNYSNVSLPIYMEANAGDHYRVQVKCVAGDDPTIRSAIFNISYLHS